MDKRDFLIYSCQKGLENNQLIKLESYLDAIQIEDYKDIFLSENRKILENVISKSSYNKLKVFDETLLDEIYNYCEKYNINILTSEDVFYPKKLKSTSDYPRCLFVNGDIEYEDISVAIVGSRKHSTYSVNVVDYIVDSLKDYGVSIISGMAYGVDTLAHKKALENNMKTIAVLGCGVDIIYPKRNEKLYQSIIEKGAVISEYPLGSSPLPYRFPQRNRIISGLSNSVIVTEARAKSGSLITARIAAEQGREVFAVPGNINSIYSEGTNLLIKDGANIFTNIDNFIEEVKGLNKIKIENVRESIGIGEDEERVLNEIKSGVKDIGLISINLQEEVSFINGIVTVLELKDLIEVTGGSISLKIK